MDGYYVFEECAELRNYHLLTVTDNKLLNHGYLCAIEGETYVDSGTYVPPRCWAIFNQPAGLVDTIYYPGANDAWFDSISIIIDNGQYVQRKVYTHEGYYSGISEYYASEVLLTENGIESWREFSVSTGRMLSEGRLIERLYDFSRQWPDSASINAEWKEHKPFPFL